MPAQTPSGFPSTCWSIVAQARGWTDEARAACNALCERYWYPVYVYLRKSGLGHEEAEDHTQGFFADFLAGERPWVNAMRKADAPGDTNFRGCLIMAVKSFLSERRREAAAQKRGGKVRIVSFDSLQAEQRYRHEPADPDHPDVLFNRSWAHEVVHAALTRVRQAYSPERFDVLKGYLTGEGAGTYVETARLLGISENGVAQAVKRLRRAFALAVRQIVAQTVADPREIDSECRALLAAL